MFLAFKDQKIYKMIYHNAKSADTTVDYSGDNYMKAL